MAQSKDKQTKKAVDGQPSSTDLPNQNDADANVPCAEGLTDGGKKRLKQTVFDTKRRIFDIGYLALVGVFYLVMWISGFNFLPLIGLVLGIFSAALLLIRALRGKAVGVFLFAAYAVSVLGNFLFFLIWGADAFGTVLWWNLVLALFPVGLGVLLPFAARFLKNQNLKKYVLAGVSFLMAGTTLVALLFSSLRLRPTVERMDDGKDDYLSHLKTQSALDSAPNVLVVLMDDMAYSDLSCYSYLGSQNATINTPNIDSIAENGVMFDNFYASSPVCSPSRFSMMTGRYASRGYLDNVVFPTAVSDPMWSPTHFINPYQFLHNVDGILGDEVTFADSLQALGYNTACIGKWNLGDYGEYLPTNHGFDYFYGSYYVNDMTPYNWVREENGVATEVRTHKENLDQSESTQIFTAEMIDFIETSVDNDEKFLAYYTSPWPHYPLFSDNNGGGKGDTADDNYIDCIEEFDRYLGDILDKLKEKGVYDDTLIMFTSDNGPGREGVTGSLRGRKNTTFDGGMKVPFLASYPNGGVGRGAEIADSPLILVEPNQKGELVARETTTKRVEASAMMFDLYPTMMQFVTGRADLMPKDRIIDGKSLYSLLRADVKKDERVHDVLYYEKRGKCQAIQMPQEVDGVVYDFKYYQSVQSENSAFFDQVYKNYLFNLDKDPAEGYNIGKMQPIVAQILHKKMVERQKEMLENRRGVIR